MRRLHLMLAAALLVACSPEPAEKAEGVASPAALPPGRPAIYQAATEGPEAFLRALYAVHTTPGAAMGAPPPPGRDPIYGRTLNAMIGADFNKAAGEVPFLNFDPVCACQDTDAFTLDSLTVTPVDARNATAIVAFTNGGQTTRQTLTLLKEGPAWRVTDITVEGQPPLTEQLLKVID